jgi:hypothetical protein
MRWPRQLTQPERNRWQDAKKPTEVGFFAVSTEAEPSWLREKDLNLRPLGYEPNELPDCSIARYFFSERGICCPLRR